MEIEAGSFWGVMRVCDVTQTWVEAKDDFENEKNHRVWNGEWLCSSTPAASLCLKRAVTIKTARKMSEWAYILDETVAKFKQAPKGGGGNLAKCTWLNSCTIFYTINYAKKTVVWSFYGECSVKSAMDST